MVPIIPIKFYFARALAFEWIRAQIKKSTLWIIRIWAITLEADFLCIGNELGLICHRSVGIVPGIQLLTVGFIMSSSYLWPKADSVEILFILYLDTRSIA